MSVEGHDPRFTEIIATEAASEVISSAFDFIEGPIWHPREKHLTFSDIPADRLYRYSKDSGVAVYRHPSEMANGNTYDRQGRILSCLHATSKVVREEMGELHVLASHFDGRELNSPNDIVVGSDGAIYFTDPTYGRSGRHGVERDLELDFRGVYRIDPDGSLRLLARDFDQPNGLCLSLDESALYVADTKSRHVRRFSLSDGQLSGGAVFCESPAPDGLKIDTLGNLYAGGPGGVHVYHRDDGNYLGKFVTPEFCANFTWGDDDFQTVYMTASTTLLRIRVRIPDARYFDDLVRLSRRCNVSAM